MAKENNNLDLTIHIHDDLKEQISNIELTSNFEVLIHVKGKIIMENLEFKKINKKSILDWSKTVENLLKKLKEVRIDSRLVENIHLILLKASTQINDYVSSNNEILEGCVLPDDKNKVKIFKYYSKVEQRIYESISISRKSCFMSYENNEASIVDKIEEDTRVLIPFGIDESPATPYEFENMEHLNGLLNKIKDMKIGDLYRQVNEVVRKYVDQKSHILSVITADVLASYFQDRFPTTHYLFFTGDNNVGKSVIGDLFDQLCYRGVKMTNPSIANVYRLLGKVEPAQCTLILDEAEDIDSNRDFMNVLKTGYSWGGKVPRINTNTLEQDFFNTYSFKVFIAERLPSSFKAKGLLDRIFPITCLLGTPQLSLKDVLVPQGKYGNQEIKKLQEEIMNLRTTLFLYRIFHALEKIPDIDTGLKNRDKELCECLALFYGSDVQQEVEDSFQILLDSRYEQKETSFDAYLLSLILNLLEDNEKANEISISDLWDQIRLTTINYEISATELFLIEYNSKLYRNQISHRCQIFGGEIKHTNVGNKIVFKDMDKLRQILASYSQNKPVIQCSSKIIHTSDVDSEGSEGSGGRTPQNNNKENLGSINHLYTGN